MNNELAELKAELALSYDPNKEKAIAGLQRLSSQLYEAKSECERLRTELVTATTLLKGIRWDQNSTVVSHAEVRSDCPFCKCKNSVWRGFCAHCQKEIPDGPYPPCPKCGIRHEPETDTKKCPGV